MITDLQNWKVKYRERKAILERKTIQSIVLKVQKKKFKGLGVDSKSSTDTEWEEDHISSYPEWERKERKRKMKGICWLINKVGEYAWLNDKKLHDAWGATKQTPTPLIK